MKKKWLVVLVLGLAVTAVALAGCATPSSVKVDLSSEQTGIQVSGTGKVTVTPDIAVLSLGVSAQATTVSDAQSQAQSAMQKVMDALEKGGVAKKDIQTQYFSIYQVTRWDDKNQKEIVIGYRVTNSVTAKIRQVDKAGAVIDAAVSAGGDLIRVSGISFTVDKPETYLKEARDKAMADAKAKAEQLASLGGVKLGKPTFISESGQFPTPMPIARMDAAKAGVPYAETVISPGETDVSLTVQVHYAIIQ